MATTAGEGAVRAGLAALCANGGFDVHLRMPGIAMSGSDAEQLGLGSPGFEDLPIGPAVWRKVGINKELLVAADPVAALMGSQAMSSAESLFQTAVGVVVDGAQYVITQSEPLAVGGVACAYRLKVQAPAWD